MSMQRRIILTCCSARDAAQRSAQARSRSRFSADELRARRTSLERREMARDEINKAGGSTVGGKKR